MAQQAIRKIKRKPGMGRPLWQGIVAAVGVTLIAVIVFALIVGMGNLSDGVIRIINQLIKIGSIFLGVWFVTPRGSDQAVRSGALIGLIYMGAGVLIYALLSGQQMDWLGYAIDLLMGVAVGGLSGMLIGSIKK